MAHRTSYENGRGQATPSTMGPLIQGRDHSVDLCRESSHGTGIVRMHAVDGWLSEDIDLARSAIAQAGRGSRVPGPWHRQASGVLTTWP